MIRSKLYNFFIEPVIAFALPAFCISCEQKLENGRKIICAPCFNQLPVLDDKYISVLFEEIKHPYFDELIIKYQFAETFQKLIHLFKYQRTLTLATYFAEAVATIIKKNNYDIITGIPLNPVKEKVRKKKATGLTLAADSPKIKSKLTSATFIDEDKHYLIKLHNFENSAKIYVFSTGEEQIKNYKIIIHPSNKIYEQSDNSKPLLIDAPVEASSIEIQFN